MSRSTWDQVFLTWAMAIAKRSRDPNTQVGCVLVSPDHRRMCAGYNGFPPQIFDDPEVYARRAEFAEGVGKDAFVVHAEMNALLQCTERPDGWTAYVTHGPCADCAKSLLAAGISRVVHYARECSTPESRERCRVGAVVLNLGIPGNVIRVAPPLS